MVQSPARVVVRSVFLGACSAFLLKFSAFLYRKLRINWGLRKTKQRKQNSILFGELPDAVTNRHRYYEWKEEICEEIGPTCAAPATIFMDGFIFSISPDFVHHILQGNVDNYIKPPRARLALDPIFGRSIFNQDHAHTKDGGALWRLQRQISVKGFTTNRFREYCADVFSKHSQEMIDTLELACASGEAVDMQDLFQKFTMRSICSIGMGCEVDDLSSFQAAFDEANVNATFRMVKPWWPYLGRFMKSEQALARSIAVVNSIANGIVERRLMESEEELAGKGDILSQFLKHRAQHPELNDRRLLRDIVIGVIGAGRDTTAACMTWTAYCLLCDDGVLRKLTEELDGVPLRAPPTFETLKSLKYLDAVIHESMRLYPPVPLDAKFAVHDDTLPDGTFVPAGCEVHFTPWVMGRSASLWKDPLVFDPSRWLGSRPSAFTYPVFQAGPRTCIGQTLAVTEAKAALLAVFSRFSLTRLSSQPAEYLVHFILMMKGGLPVSVQKRGGGCT